MTAVTATTIRMIVTQTGAALTTKTKLRFDAVTADQDNFGTIPTRPPLASALNATPGKTEAKQKDQPPSIDATLRRLRVSSRVATGPSTLQNVIINVLMYLILDILIE